MGSKNIHWFLKTFQQFKKKMFRCTKKYILILKNKKNKKGNRNKHVNEKIKIYYRKRKHRKKKKTKKCTRTTQKGKKKS